MKTDHNLKIPLVEKTKDVLKGVIAREDELFRLEQLENLVCDALAQYRHDGKIENDTHVKLMKLIDG